MSSFLFLVDTSGSMYGQKIAAVNAALTEGLDEIRRMEAPAGESVDVSIAVFDERMEFLEWKKEAARLVLPCLAVEADADGFYPVTSYAGLCRGLQDLFSEGKGCDYLFLVTDGRPADAEEYTEELELLKNDSGYRKACKYVVLAGEDPGSLEREILHFVEDQADHVIRLADLSSELSRIGMILDVSNDTEGLGEEYAKYEEIFRD